MDRASLLVAVIFAGFAVLGAVCQLVIQHASRRLPAGTERRKDHSVAQVLSLWLKIFTWGVSYGFMKSIILAVGDHRYSIAAILVAINLLLWVAVGCSPPYDAAAGFPQNREIESVSDDEYMVGPSASAEEIPRLPREF